MHFVRGMGSFSLAAVVLFSILAAPMPCFSSAISSTLNAQPAPSISISPITIQTVPAPPTGLSTAPGASCVNLTWTAALSAPATPVLNYTVYRRTNATSLARIALIGNRTWFNDTSAVTGTRYTYRVSANNSLGESAMSAEASSMPWSVPGAVTDLQALRGDGIVNLTWSAISSADTPVVHVSVHRGANPGSETLLVNTAPGSFFNDLSVTNGLTYHYRITSTNAAGESLYSNEVNATPMAVPSQPLNLTGNFGPESAALSWSAPSANGGGNVTSYRIYRGAANGSLATIGNVTVTWYNDSSLANGVPYRYAVSAVNAAGEGPLSNLTEVVPASLPDAPSLHANSADVVVKLTITRPSGNGRPVMGYVIYKGTEKELLSPLQTIGLATKFNDTSVSNGQTYYYAVSALNAVGEGPKSLVKSAKPFTIPGVPQTAIALGEHYAIRVSWTPPTNNGGDDIVQYKIYKNGSAIPYTVVGGSIRSMVDDLVSPGVIYTYRISAVNGAGEGPKASNISASGYTIPGAPQNAAAAAGNSSITLTWQPPSFDGGRGVTGYNVYRKAGNGTEQLEASLGNVTSFEDAGLAPGDEFSYRVAAVNVAGEGAKSSEATAAVPLSESASSAREPLVSWQMLLLIVLVVVAAAMCAKYYRVSHRESRPVNKAPEKWSGVEEEPEEDAPPVAGWESLRNRKR